jgi:murein DD-endopeptidase MepM/ murein hydrolase activator NlpD
MQKLILPINDASLTASMGTENYRSRFGFSHYGADMISRSGNRVIYASGKGEVLETGWDNVVGYVVAVLYPQAICRRTGEIRDMIFRYYHLERIDTAKGKRVTKDSRLGLYGNTGSLVMGRHLHVEADKDIAYPLYSPTVKRSNFLRGRDFGAHAGMMENPVDWLACKTSPPDHQSWTTAADAYILPADRVMENIV